MNLLKSSLDVILLLLIIVVDLMCYTGACLLCLLFVLCSLTADHGHHISCIGSAAGNVPLSLFLWYILGLRAAAHSQRSLTHPGPHRLCTGDFYVVFPVYSLLLNRDIKDP